MQPIFRIILAISLIFSYHFSAGQIPTSNQGNEKPGMKQMNIGHFYGKVIDAKTGKGIEYATLQLFRQKVDTVSNLTKLTLVSGALSESNGDFNIENLPLFGNYVLKITALGYDSISEKVAFDVNPDQKGNMQQVLGAAEKDLGNIKLHASAIELAGVTVTDEEPQFKLELDKKVYNAEKDPSNTGGTAEDVLKKVPSVTVDIDGNVALRNATPQIFVDGRPTTLSIDQIPSDAIEKIEVITNPSAKYDASGGQAGIINIVLKKNKRIGYNGNIRAGVDTRGRINGGADINLRQGKVNVFANLNINQRKSLGFGETDRYNTFELPFTNQFQNDTINSRGFFTFGNAGIDYFWNNRNTLTVSGTVNRGSFNALDDIYMQTDTLLESGTNTTYSFRNTDNERDFHNLGGVIQYKHLFPEEDRQWTADINYNRSKSSTNGVYTTQYFDENYFPSAVVDTQLQDGSGSNEFFTAQSDYVDPITDDMKIEAGIRGAIRNFTTENHNYLFNHLTQQYIEVPGINSYTFNDQVYAAYATFSSVFKKFQYQVGLRVESSFYTGKLIDSEEEFSNDYPLSLFPSGFITYAIDENNDFQLNYSRRVDRPTFFQLIPFTDYSDTLNLQRGNPDLKPQFTNTAEFSYQTNFDKSNNLLLSLYFKNTYDLITRFQILEYDSLLNKQVIINTWENANSSNVYGLEITSSNTIKKWLSITTGLNFYNVNIDGTNIETGLTNQQFSWLAKTNMSFKLPVNFTFQVIADYQSKTAIPQNSGGGGGGGGGRGMGGGGGGWFGPPPATVQGYTEPVYGVDLALKKEFLKNKAASLTLTFSDIFRSRKYTTSYETDFFNQTSSRQRDPQLLRLTFNLKFGKFDTALFKRKNLQNNGEMMQEMQ